MPVDVRAAAATQQRSSGPWSIRVSSAATSSFDLRSSPSTFRPSVNVEKTCCYWPGILLLRSSPSCRWSVSASPASTSVCTGPRTSWAAGWLLAAAVLTGTAVLCAPWRTGAAAPDRPSSWRSPGRNGPGDACVQRVRRTRDGSREHRDSHVVTLVSREIPAHHGGHLLAHRRCARRPAVPRGRPPVPRSLRIGGRPRVHPAGRPIPARRTRITRIRAASHPASPVPVPPRRRGS